MGDIVEYIVSVIIIGHFIWAIYLITLGVAAWFYKKRGSDPRIDKTFLVLIPAFNEEKHIAHAVRSVLNCDYAREKMGIAVIADNCTDETARIAKEAGADVVERQQPENTGKGQALDWFLRTQQEHYASYDAIAIVDADTFVHPEFLREVNFGLADPKVRVVQGFYGISNILDSKNAALQAASFNNQHHTRQAGRLQLRGSASLVGNGMAFEVSVLKRYGWPAQSIVEDMEFSLHLARENVKVHYNPDAMVFSQAPAEVDTTMDQHRRWEGGRFLLIRNYFFPLVRGYYSTGKFRYVGVLFDLLTPPLTVCAGLMFILLVISLIFMPFMIGFVLFAWAGVLIFGTCGQFQRRAPKPLWMALFWTPVYLAKKVVMYGKMFIEGIPKTWNRTRRT